MKSGSQNINFLLLLAISLFFSFSITKAQQNKKDSLLKALGTLTREDTSKVKVLNKLGEWHFLNDDFIAARKYIDEAVALAQKINDKKGLGNAFFNIGVIYYFQSDYTNAVIYYKRALDIRLEMGDKNLVANTYNNLAVIYYEKGEYNEALKYHGLAIKVREAMGDRKGLSSTYNNIGLIQESLGNYPEALKNMILSLKLEEELNNVPGVANSYLNVGNIYHTIKDDSSALVYYEKVVELSKKAGYTKGLAKAYGNIGLVKFVKRDFEGAEKNYREVLKIHEGSQDKSGKAIVYNNLGNLNLEKGAYDTSLKFFKLSLNLFKELGDQYRIALSYNNIGRLLFWQKKPAEGKDWSLKCLTIAKEIGARDILKQCYENLYIADSLIEDKQGEFVNYQTYILYRDSLLNEETTKKMIRQQMQYEFGVRESVRKAEQEKKDLQAAREQERQRYLIYSVGTGSILVLFFVFYALWANIRKRKLNEELGLQKSIIEEKQKEILDSIRYARRIQASLLPTEKYIIKKLSELGKKY
jgi:tetratricopeptide (TPR) repeat protein